MEERDFALFTGISSVPETACGNHDIVVEWMDSHLTDKNGEAQRCEGLHPRLDSCTTEVFTEPLFLVQNFSLSDSNFWASP